MNKQKRRFLSLIFWLILGGLLAGCSDGKPPGIQQPANPLSDSAVGEITPDIPVPDVPGDLVVPPKDGEKPVNCEAAATGGPQPFLCPCDQNTDCESGFCLQTPDGKVCSRTCIEECPAGWTCKILIGTCPDCQFACIPKFLNLCRPCNTNAECENLYGTEGERCVIHGDAGQFCGVGCSADDSGATCPPGYHCELAATVSGTSNLQCIPDDGVCTCSNYAVEVGATTSCNVTNDLGSCAGQRTCTEVGISPCDADSPKAEECDGLDNDCDGLLDEGTCPGGAVCACSDNGCACGCPPGTVDCGSGCVDVSTSIAHCGDCNKPCVADHVNAYQCTDGTCGIAKCQEGFADKDSEFVTGCECPIEPEACDGLDNNCNSQVDEGQLCVQEGEGACAGQCVDGACQCPTGCDSCGSSCLPIDAYASDVNNCGYCTNKCDLPNTGIHKCDAGICCSLVCKTGFKDCNADCTDGCEWEVKPETCDGLDNDCDSQVDEGPLLDCTAPKKCVSGACICDPALANLKLCDGQTCSDILTDAANCGTCGNDCASLGLANVKAYKCVDGQCQIAQCTPPFVDTDEQTFNGCECGITSATEMCDGADNTCDGVIDGQSQACMTNCGTGEEACVGGQWVGCTATAPLTCTNYANCQQEETCFETCPDPPQDICNGVDDNCNNTVDEGFTCIPAETMTQPCGNCGSQIFSCSNSCEWEKLGECLSQSVCTPGETDTQTCGKCGTQERSCTAQCGWSEWGACTGEGLCGVGTIETDNCGNCGTKTRQCSGQCTWNTWSSCDGQGQCAPAEQNTQNCGNCGVQTKTCSSQCNWSDWGACGGQGSCAASTNQSQGCGMCGSQERTCTAQCSWPSWGSCNGQGVCSPGTSDAQACADCGSQTRTCSAQCGWSSWGACGGTGICTPGKVETKACGNCGVQTRTCTSQCGWSNWSSCQSQGVCSPGTTDTGSCGNCGTQNRTCTNQCSWGGWGTCNGQGSCAANTTDTQSCGQCGSQTRSCSSQCEWSSWGACGSQGACSPGQAKSQSCGSCGTQTATCTSQCSWSGWGSCSGQGVCSPGVKDSKSCGDCGSQSRTCTSQCSWGGWNSCSEQGVCSPNQTKSQTCGACGSQKATCSSQCQWGGWGSCTGQGSCSPGKTKSQACGDCGSQTAMCSSQCQWGGWAACTGQGACSPGKNENQACGDCGTQSRTCNSQCNWSGWTGCSGQGSCSPGSSDSQSCGNCGNQYRYCSSQCNWGNWGTCFGQGQCTPNDTNTTSCGNCGTKLRTCTSQCSWGSYGSCGSQGVCSSGSQANCTDGCGKKTCSNSCSYGSCNFTKDQYEPNDTYAQAELWGSTSGYSEGASIPVVTSATLHQAEPAIATPGEIDRYYLYVKESGSWFDYSMTFSATLSGISGWHKVCVYFDKGCNGGVDKTHCASGFGSLTATTGDVDDVGSTDDGCVDIEVYGDWSCTPYTLQFKLD
jgi:hypothetical protein